MGRFLRRLPRSSAPPARAAGLLLALSAGLAGLLAAASCTPAGATGEDALVVRAVDGDTLVVRLAGREERVRLIGVDTPETVHPRRPVEFFGKEASAFTRRAAAGKRVRLEPDPSLTDRDRYGRLLRYVFLPDGTLLNAALIAEGYGHAYTRFPFGRMEEFRSLERRAREEGRGLWAPRVAPGEAVPLEAAAMDPPRGGEGGDAPGPGKGSAGSAGGLRGSGRDRSAGSAGRGAPAGKAGADREKAVPRPEGRPGDVVYITSTGTRYHAEGCRHLRRSRLAVTLREAAGKYRPCSVCRPPRLPPGPEDDGRPRGERPPD